MDVRESDRLAGDIKSLKRKTGYLLLVTGYNAGKNLTKKATESLSSLGLKGNLHGKNRWNQIALVRLVDRKVLIEKSETKRIHFSVGKVRMNVGFDVSNLTARRSSRKSN